jgi:hypothetical protein
MTVNAASPLFALTYSLFPQLLVALLKLLPYIQLYPTTPDPLSIEYIHLYSTQYKNYLSPFRGGLVEEACLDIIYERIAYCSLELSCCLRRIRIGPVCLVSVSVLRISVQSYLIFGIHSESDRVRLLMTCLTGTEGAG